MAPPRAPSSWARRLAGLGDSQGQGARHQHRIAIAELRGEVHIHRHARQLLHHVSTDDTRVQSRAAGDDLYTLNPRQGFIRPLVAFEDRVTDFLPDALEGGLGQHIRLLVDLLQHVVGPVAEVRVLRLPLHQARDALPGLPVEPVNLRATGFQDSHIAVFQVDDFAPVGQEPEHIGSQIGSGSATPGGLPTGQGQGRALAGTHNAARRPGRDEGHRVVAPGFSQGLAYGVEEGASGSQAAPDHMGQNLRIRIRSQPHPDRLQLSAQGGVVLNDAVVHHGHAAGAVHMRVRVAVRRRTVGCPARVTNARRGSRRISTGPTDRVPPPIPGRPQRHQAPRRQALLQVHQAPGATTGGQGAVHLHGHAGGVIAPVLQHAQAFHQAADQARLRPQVPDGSHYSAHLESP